MAGKTDAGIGGKNRKGIGLMAVLSSLSYSFCSVSMVMSNKVCDLFFSTEKSFCFVLFRFVFLGGPWFLAGYTASGGHSVDLRVPRGRSPKITDNESLVQLGARHMSSMFLPAFTYCSFRVCRVSEATKIIRFFTIPSFFWSRGNYSYRDGVFFP